MHLKAYTIVLFQYHRIERSRVDQTGVVLFMCNYLQWLSKLRVPSPFISVPHAMHRSSVSKQSRGLTCWCLSQNFRVGSDVVPTQAKASGRAHQHHSKIFPVASRVSLFSLFRRVDPHTQDLAGCAEGDVECDGQASGASGE